MNSISPSKISEFHFYAFGVFFELFGRLLKFGNIQKVKISFKILYRSGTCGQKALQIHKITEGQRNDIQKLTIENFPIIFN